MGMFGDVVVDSSIELPHFPEEIDRDGIVWQSKEGLDVYGGPYRITSDGRLEEKKTRYRDKTDDEKLEEAQKWGFDSWDEYIQAYEENKDSLYPDEIDYDIDRDGDEDHPPLFPSEKKVDETWWEDIYQHGTFEFHHVLQRDPLEYEEIETANGGTMERVSEYALDVYIEYEARFTEGNLDEIVFRGQRMPRSDDPIQSALDQIESWRAWKEG